MTPLAPCATHPIHRDLLGLAPTCPAECDYWTRRRDYCAALTAAMARPSAPLAVPTRIAKPQPAPSGPIRREFLAPLMAQPGAARALGLFAEGKITATGLQARLMTASRRLANPATADVIGQFVFRAVCARFGLPLGATATETTSEPASV